ncbi:unnamed protein product [Urochloa humidicola]
MSPPRPHFLVLTYPLQGHIAPALRLARRLLAVAPDALVTFSTTEAAHRRLFPATPENQDGLNGVGGGRLELLPFSDGTAAGYGGGSDVAEFNAYMSSFHAAGPRSVGELLDALAARGRPVSRVVYTLMLPWAASRPRSTGSSPPSCSPSTTTTSTATPPPSTTSPAAATRRWPWSSLACRRCRSGTCPLSSPSRPPTRPTTSTRCSSRSATCSTPSTGRLPRPPSS